MKIVVRPAVPGDAMEIYEIMHAARNAMKDPSAYIADDIEYITSHICSHGFTLIAEADGKAVGFFLVCVSGLDDNNLGYYLDFSQQQLMETALMDSSAVLPEYQGRGIMGMLFREAVVRTEKEYPWLLGTVHPDNLPSRRNFEKNGFTVYKTIVKPGGQVRLLMGRHREIPG